MTETKDLLPVIYVAFLLVLLAGAAWFIIQQIFKTRRVENSLSRLQAKLSQGKGTAQEHYELGGIYLEKRLYAQAIVQFQKALKDSNLPEEEAAPIYNALGFAYFAQEQYDMAIRQYKEALKVSPEYVTAANNLGHAYEQKNLVGPALEAYEVTLKVEPENPTAKRRAESLRKRVIPTTNS
ncbi:MAG: tetratricopeptide repeat protein [Leptolyngbyaceae cyanobacterium bins.59]|nr:tetratricopeptide repeat protein [Leptolyngbyaceae cyanobacterium bins.59]